MNLKALFYTLIPGVKVDDIFNRINEDYKRFEFENHDTYECHYGYYVNGRCKGTENDTFEKTLKKEIDDVIKSSKRK